MTLVDTSVWVDHFRNGSRVLGQLLRDSEVLVHPFVVGELALGRIRNRREIMDLLANLPGIEVAEHREVMHLVENRDLGGSGIGWIDAHLIASAMIARARLLTVDKALLNAARSVGIAAVTGP
jgi:predicted nucleic acid-binding protein